MKTATAEVTDLELVERPKVDQPLATVPNAAVAEVGTAGPLAMAMQAMKAGMSIADMRGMLELQKEWEANEALKAYNDAMALFSGEAIEIIKRKQVDFANSKGGRTQYKHAELSDVVEAVKPVLAKHGFSYRWDTKQERDWLNVTCILKHRLGHFESCTLGGPPDQSGGKNFIQGFKSTKTYLERQTLEAICGVTEKGEDNDGAGAGSGDTPQIPDELLARAQDASMSGWKSLATFIKTITPQERQALEPVSNSLKAAAKAADQKGAKQ